MSNYLKVFTEAAKGRPIVQSRLVSALRKKNKANEANALALQLWKERGDEPQSEMLFREVLSADVPQWHFGLVRDTIRNDAYEAALRRAIRPGMRVLDIGSGTGLLAMMAARAGAEHVYSCEMNPAVADAAREIVAANGYADRVSILPVHSGSLDADRDLGGKVDIIVSEIVSNDMLAECVLDVMEDVVPRLLKPGGVLIPARGTVRVALAEVSAFVPEPMTSASGFDLSLFNRLAKPSFRLKVGNSFEIRSSAGELFHFDFAAETTPDAEARCTLTATGGTANAIIQWIQLDMDEEGRYEVRPGVYSCWAINCWPLPEPVKLPAGESFTVGGLHDRISVKVYAIR